MLAATEDDSWPPDPTRRYVTPGSRVCRSPTDMQPVDTFDLCLEASEPSTHGTVFDPAHVYPRVDQTTSVVDPKPNRRTCFSGSPSKATLRPTPNHFSKPTLPTPDNRSAHRSNHAFLRQGYSTSASQRTGREKISHLLPERHALECYMAPQ